MPSFNRCNLTENCNFGAHEDIAERFFRNNLVLFIAACNYASYILLLVPCKRNFTEYPQATEMQS